MIQEKHYITRIGWLRAGVLGANDGILSTTSLVIGVAAASEARDVVVLTALSGLIAGAMSMAAGEYISVSSQLDTEKADTHREKQELAEMPEQELQELTEIYRNRGLSEALAKQVAVELSANNALDAHLRDELGITDQSTAKPFQAAIASFLAFVAGAILPLLVAIFFPIPDMVYGQYGFAILFLIVLGAVAARAGGAPVGKSILRIALWGTIAMASTALVGHIFGAQLS